MTALEFVEYISSRAPMVEALTAQGCPEELAPEEVESLRPRKTGYSGDLADPLLRLCTDYLFSRSLPHGIALAKPVAAEQFWIVGTQEGDPLTIDKESGEVQIEDSHSRTRWTLSHCAKDSAHFLSAYSYAIGYVYKRDVSQTEAIDRCATLAGGEVYRAFYNGMLFRVVSEH